MNPMTVQARQTVAFLRSAGAENQFKPHFWFEVDDDLLDVSLADERRLADHVNEYLTVFTNVAHPEPIGFCIRQFAGFWALLCHRGLVTQTETEISIVELLRNAAAQSTEPKKSAHLLSRLLQKIEGEYAGSLVKPRDLLAGRLISGALTTTAVASILEPVRS